MNISRRQWMQAAGAAMVLPNQGGAQDQDFEVRISAISAHTVRLTVLPAGGVEVPSDGSLVQESWGEPIAKLRRADVAQTIQAGELRITVSSTPLTFAIETKSHEPLQR